MLEGLFMLLPLLLLSGKLPQTACFNVGINYGQIANNLPAPLQVAQMLEGINIKRVKLYDASPDVLKAFANSDVDLTIGIRNEDLPNLRNPSNAEAWLVDHVKPYLPQTRITCITVGNEVLSDNNTDLPPLLLPVMQNVYAALKDLKLDQVVEVTTSHSFTILSNSYPPSSGAFRPELLEHIQPLLNYQTQINSSFLINAYPYFAYNGSPQQISLNYVLFEQNDGMIDPTTGLKYDNMLYAQIDAVYVALQALGYRDIKVRISETGWPSKGEPSEIGATRENAATYNKNLLQRISQKEGTPLKPSTPLDVHVFALFNEDLKPGPTSERNYGLFYPNCTYVYDIGLQGRLSRQFTASSPSSSLPPTMIAFGQSTALMLRSVLALQAVFCGFLTGLTLVFIL